MSTEVAKVPSRELIEKLEAEMFKMPQLEIKTTHYLAAGLYAREILIPAGALVTGKVHKCEHLNIVSKGRIQVWTEDGMREVSAPFTMVSRKGTKRVGLAIEDTVWTTIHATSLEGDEITPELLQALEAELIEPPALLIDNGKEPTPCLGSPQQ